MKCSIWEFPENIEMSISADDSNCFSLKHAAELPIDTSIVYLTISFNTILTILSCTIGIDAEACIKSTLAKQYFELKI